MVFGLWGWQFSMDNAKKTIIIAIAEFLFLSLLAISIPFILLIDILIIGHGVQEVSLTELTQEALILISALLFVINVFRRPRSRGFLVLVASLFFCMFIREMDDFLNKMVFDGFWFWPATFLAAGSTTYSMTCKETILAPMADFFSAKSGLYIFFGLIILLGLSRSFGSGNLLWKHIMGENYRFLYKATIQEGLELFGYMLICYGSCLFLHHKEGFHKNNDTA